jgi:hypothetical protein
MTPEGGNIITLPTSQLKRHRNTSKSQTNTSHGDQAANIIAQAYIQTARPHPRRHTDITIPHPLEADLTVDVL